MSTTHPLLHAGWAEFACATWGLTPLPWSFGTKDARLETLLFTDARGRIVRPPIAPYVPLAFFSTATTPTRRGAEWLEVATSLAEMMRRRGVLGTVPLDPGTPDARPWLWQSFALHTVHTYHLPLPYDLQCANESTRRQARRAEKSGYVCTQVTSFADVMACLVETEARQGFRTGLAAPQLDLLYRAMGADACRAYVCYAADGQPASARVILWTPGGPAIDWLVGTRTEHLSSSATQTLIAYVLADLARAGALLFDFEGADIKGVARAKMGWGGTLVPFTAIRQPSWRSTVGAARDALKASPIGPRLLGPWRALKRWR
jgi:hypothetical protein